MDFPRIVGFAGIGLTVVVGGVLIVGSVLPKDYAVERSIVIDAPQDVVFEQVVDLRLQEGWSPWKAHDPTMKWSFGDSARGEGALYAWKSENSGSGQYTITEVEGTGRLVAKVVFDDVGESIGTWTFVPEGEGTRVTWGFTGRTGGVIGGYYALMMDSMVGAAFDEGLAGLKAQAEAAPPLADILAEGRHRGILTMSTEGSTFLACDEDAARPVKDDLGEVMAAFRAASADEPLDVYVEVEGGPFERSGLHARRLLFATTKEVDALCGEPLGAGQVAGGTSTEDGWYGRIAEGSLKAFVGGESLMADVAPDGEATWKGSTIDGRQVEVSLTPEPCTQPGGAVATGYAMRLVVDEDAVTGCGALGW